MPSTMRRIQAGVGRGADARPLNTLPGLASIPTGATACAAGSNGRAAEATGSVPGNDDSLPGSQGSTRAYHPIESLGALRADPRQAIQEHSIRCLICGQVFRQLTNTHLRTHNTGTVDYKQRFGYNRGRPLMCHVLQRMYADRAVKSGLAGRIRCRPILVQPGLRRLGGSRAIALEELLTRREARRRAAAQNGARP
jgi:ROS/MUCR transcriptional regulator protein